MISYSLEIMKIRLPVLTFTGSVSFDEGQVGCLAFTSSSSLFNIVVTSFLRESTKSVFRVILSKAVRRHMSSLVTSETELSKGSNKRRKHRLAQVSILDNNLNAWRE